MPNPSSSPKPAKISRYEIIRELGRGGMATVYLARDPNFQREVAIKILPRETMHDSTLYQRFQREARTIASLEHPAIVPVHDFGEEDGQPYLVMRYLSGGSLSARIKAGPMPVAEAAKVLQRIGDALDAAHAKGIVHRDLKPANILFDQYGNAYLSDFGIAQLSEATSPLTGSAIIGTPSYMSPEQIRGEGKVDGRADIYALGIVLFEMLTGKAPFKADTPAQMLMMHLANPTPRLPEEQTSLPNTLNGVLIRAMAKDPDLRFQKASELGSVVSAIASGQAPDLSETAPTFGYFKETAATRIEPEDGGARKPHRAVTKATDEEPRKQPAKKWPLIAAAAAVLCICGVGGAAGGYALYKNPDALSSLLSPKETVPVTATPTEELFAGFDITPTWEVFPSDGGQSGSPADTSNLVGDKFEIAIGDEIADGVPGPGAGNIETPGTKDIYTFEASQGQTIFIQTLDLEATDDIAMVLIDSNGNKVKNCSLTSTAPDLYGFGSVKLIAGGKYILVVGEDKDPVIGTYKLKIWNVPDPDTFTFIINPSFTISDGVPGPGAGRIESPGVKDIYTFEAAAGQTIFIQTLDLEATDDIAEELIDSNGNTVARCTIASTAPDLYSCGSVKLILGGAYTFVVGEDEDPVIGTYKLKFWNLPNPNTFAININPSFTISDGVPGPGAGRIESPGAIDIYTFEAAEGQTIFIQTLGLEATDDIAMVLMDSNGNKVKNCSLTSIAPDLYGCGSVKLIVGGRYSLIIGEDKKTVTGMYKLIIWGQGSPK
jgi:hypothetical protein